MAGETTTTARACEAIGIGDRQVRRLIRAKRLDVVGKGQSRRITWASIERYREEARKTDIEADMSFPMSGVSGEDQIVQHMKKLPALSEPAAAARRLGVGRETFDKMITAGAVPVIRIGTNRFIGRRWLGEVLAKANGLPAPGVSE